MRRGSLPMPVGRVSRMAPGPISVRAGGRPRHLVVSVFLLQCYLLLSPFYVFRSGTAQPADLVLVGVFGLFVINRSMKRVLFGSESLKRLSHFVIWVALVNTGWAVLTLRIGAGVGSTAWTTLFYVFNLLAFGTVSLVVARGFGRAITRGLALTALLQMFLLLSPVAPVAGFRQQLFFNNPNQLGYFALLIATGLVLSRVPENRGGTVLKIAALGACFILCIASLSKAAILAMALLLLLSTLRKPLTIGAAITLFAMAFLGTATESTYTARLEARFTHPGYKGDETLAQRGYDRIINHPEHLLLGAGEGDFYRFSSVFEGELHSTWGTILFAYGVVGLVLFGRFLLVGVRRLGKDALVLLPVAFYGLTHQGLRFTPVWFVLAIGFSRVESALAEGQGLKLFALRLNRPRFRRRRAFDVRSQH